MEPAARAVEAAAAKFRRAGDASAPAPLEEEAARYSNNRQLPVPYSIGLVLSD
jgi:hypothetical protein